METVPRSPCAPVGACWPALNRRGCASLLYRVGQFIGGSVAGPVRFYGLKANDASPFPQAAPLKVQRPANGTSAAPRVTALSVEFVAKPQEAHRGEAVIPAAIAGALKDVAGFAGCLVMISDQEARLVTVVTLWAGDDRVKRCGQNVRWVPALLKPYLHHCLRVHTRVADVPLFPAIRPETIAADESSMTQDLLSENETICVA